MRTFLSTTDRPRRPSPKRRRTLDRLLIALVCTAALSAHARVLEEIVVRVNDQIITRSELERQEQDVLQTLYQQFSGEQLDLMVSEAKRNLLRDLVSSVLLYQYGERMGLDLDGVFESYVEDLKRSAGIRTEDEFRRLLREEGLSLDDYRKRVLESRVPRIVVYHEVLQKVSVSDEEIQQYIGEHSDEFAEPARVTLREIVLLFEDAETRASTEQFARQLVAQLRDGADFEEMVRLHSDSPSKDAGGLLGDFAPGELARELDELVFELADATPESGPIISDPIEVGAGFHIVEVMEHQAAEAPDQDVLNERVYLMLREEKAAPAYDTFLQQLWEDNYIVVSEGYRDRLPPTDS